ncbi:MAG: ATP-dependent sacrificial sulfur transferase LarE [Candidatus Omnitrophica bacterium]|nr:ATP-dependent sacrificial sulfur transferase LarE [Candidatus Omnitrophota bacterium]
MDKVVVAFSGGLDSTLLLKVALDTLGRENVLAVTAKSATYPEREHKSALKLMQKLKAHGMTIHTKETANAAFLRNPVNRCYYCKKELFGRLAAIADKGGFLYVIDGFNRDDKNDLRFGAIAGRELGVRSPLAEAGIGKRELRAYSRKLGLSTWDKPSFACLASRFPYGDRITRAKLGMINRAEEALQRQGFKQVRVRIHGKIARLEVLPDNIKRFSDMRLRKAVISALRKLGFSYITLDLEGYRTGSMNEVLYKMHRKKCYVKEIA